MKKISVLFVFLFSFVSSFAQKQLWGMTCTNGAVSGTIFKTDSVGNNYTDVYTFINASDGIDPYGSLVLATDGYLYGLTKNGGTNNSGTIFKFDPVTLVYFKVHDFDSINGQYPYGSLVQASNGKLYGMTCNGGVHNDGVIFEYDLFGSGFTKKMDFNMQNGAHSYGSLIEAADGTLYGLSSQGGVDGTGAMFQYDFNTATYTGKYGFVLGPSLAGYDPRGSLLQTPDGTLYGMSRYGLPGFTNGGGVIFKYDLALPYWTAFSHLHTFDEFQPGSLNGFELMGSLIRASNGNLYGMTQNGGIDSSGIIFEFNTTTNTVVKLYDFNHLTDGYNPYGSLMQASDGKLYGLTTSDSGQSKMFQFDITTGIFTVKANVTGTPYFTSLIETGNMSIGIKKENQNDPFRVYPVPTVNNLNFDFPNRFEISEIQVLDMFGKIVFFQCGNFHLIDTEHLNSGMYQLKVVGDQKTVFRTFYKME